MPRPERPLDPEAGPVRAFAFELRELRQRAGNPTYLKMARASGKSRTALTEAAGGDHLATWETVSAYVLACGGNPASWRPKWEVVSERHREQRGLPAPDWPAGEDEVKEIGNPPESSSPPGAKLSGRVAFGAGAASLAILGGVVAVLLLGGGGGDALPASATDAKQPPGPKAITVQNKVASGPSTLTEDTTPAYLSSKPIARCSKRGCKVEGTDMWSGATFAVTCWATGEEITNQDTTSAGIEQNPHAATSSRWYRGEWPDGRAGYLSEVYVAQEYRGGLGLPECRRIVERTDSADLRQWS
jgi:hypothetical protein